MPGIRKRSSRSWEITIFLGRDENGKRERQYKTVRGTKAEALQKQREMQYAIDRGIIPTKVSYKISEWLDKWMEDKVTPFRKEKTIDRYEGIIRLHIKPALGHTDITKLTPSDVQDFETQLIQQGMSARGVGLIHTVLSGGMKHALRLDLINRNPVSLVSPPPSVKVKAYTPEIEQVRKLLAYAERTQHRLWVYFHVLAYTGMRRGEALALEWQHVDLDEMRIQVKQTLGVPKKGLVLGSPKTISSGRVINTDPRTTEILRQHRDRQLAIAAELSFEPPEKVFPRADLGNWEHPNTVASALQTLVKKAGCDKITMRSLRHFHITIILQAGESVAVAAERAGHSSPKTTMDVYAHVLPGWQQSTAAAFANVMQPEDDQIAGQMPDNSTGSDVTTQPEQEDSK